MSNNDYKIQKERLTVVLTTVSGDRLAGDLFVQPRLRGRTGREEAPDVFNAAEPFFPFQALDGDLHLIAKAHVREVELPADLEVDEWRIGSWQEVEVVLVGGEQRTGVVYLEAITGRARVLDYLNRTRDRFLTLHTDSTASLINRELIERIRPLD